MQVVFSVLEVFRRGFSHVVVVFNAMASFWILVIMLLITFDIFSRYALGAPINGVTEIVEISIVIILFLQMTDALKAGRITRSDALHSRILARWPVAGHTMDVAFNLAGAILMIMIVKGVWPKWIQAYESGYFVGNVGVFTFPEWPQLFVIVLGCTAMAIQFLLLATNSFLGIIGKPPLGTTSLAREESGTSEE